MVQKCILGNVCRLASVESASLGRLDAWNGLEHASDLCHSGQWASCSGTAAGLAEVLLLNGFGP